MLFDSIPRAFGLDIGDHAVKIVLLEKRRDLRGKTNYVVKNYSETILPAGLIVDGEIKDALKTRLYIKTALQTAVCGPIKLRGAVVSLPESKTFLQEIIIPKATNGSILPLIKGDLEKEIPLSVDELYLDWQEVETVSGGTHSKILVSAAPKTLVDSYTSLVESAGLLPLVLEPESLALARSTIDDTEIHAPEETTLIVDIGSERTSIVFWQNGTVRLSITSPISGRALTAAIAEKEKVSLDEAERMKITCGLNPDNCGEKIRPIILSSIEELIKNTRAALRFHQEHLSIDSKMEKIIISGGGANLNHLENVLSQELKIKVRHATQPKNIIRPKYLAFGPEKYLSFATATGLARRAADNQLFNE